MATQRWKVTLVLDLEEGSHPQDFVPEAINMGFREGEDMADYRFEEVDADFSFPSEEG